jgi:hypothetical protein
MNKFIDRIKCKWRSKRVSTVADARDLNLIWINNVHGDFIHLAGCRSLWEDDYFNMYKCDQILKNADLERPNHLGLLQYRIMHVGPSTGEMYEKKWKWWHIFTIPFSLLFLHKIK